MDKTPMREALEAARDLLLPQCNGGTAFAKACGETVDKIMAALKDERTSDGNAAEMYEALTKVKEWMEHRIATRGFESSATIPTMLEDVVLPALAAPPRNCNVGTVMEQEDRFEKFCNAHKYVGDDGTNWCSRDCPCYNGMDCGIRWAQMPYGEGGAK